MKRSIQSLIINTGYSSSGTLEGGFGSIRGGTAANDFLSNQACLNDGNCNGTVNAGHCFNRFLCQNSSNSGGCTNQNGGCAGSTNQMGCVV